MDQKESKRNTKRSTGRKKEWKVKGIEKKNTLNRSNEENEMQIEGNKEEKCKNK